MGGYLFRSSILGLAVSSSSFPTLWCPPYALQSGRAEGVEPTDLLPDHSSTLLLTPNIFHSVFIDLSRFRCRRAKTSVRAQALLLSRLTDTVAMSAFPVTSKNAAIPAHCRDRSRSEPHIVALEELSLMSITDSPLVSIRRRANHSMFHLMKDSQHRDQPGISFLAEQLGSTIGILGAQGHEKQPGLGLARQLSAHRSRRTASEEIKGALTSTPTQ